MTDWREVGRKVARTAPVLGAALGGPAGGAVGALIAQAFGTADDPVAVAEAMVADPEAAMKLRELELRHAEAISSLIVSDRQHARTTHLGHWMPWALTAVLAVMVSALLAGLILLDTPPANREVVYLIAGQLIGAFATAVAYWLGSSRGSVEKQAEITRLR